MKIHLTKKELDLLAEERRGHMDIVTELGIAFKQPIPKGQAFIDWIADERVQTACVAHLLRRNFSWHEIQEGLVDLSHWRWLPSIEQLQLTQKRATQKEKT